MNISIKHTEPPSLNTMKNEVITIKYNKKDDFYPDNYYKYNLNGVLKSDFSKLNLSHLIHLYMLVVLELLKVNLIKLYKIHLEYLLFKYPSNNSSHSNLCIFPFRILGKRYYKTSKQKIIK